MPRSSPYESGGPLLSTDQVAARLGVTPKTVRALVSRRELLCHRVGRVWRYRPEEVERFLEISRVLDSAERRMA